MGRPTDYNQEIVDLICERLADGETLKAICSDDNLPAKSTVFRWLAAHESFRDLYARAREAQGDALIDEAREIVDDGSNDWMERNFKDQTAWVLNGEAVARSRLRVDQRRWEASKLKPKVYGDKLAVEHSGSITITTVDEDELRAELIELIASGKLKLPGGLEVEERDEPAADDECEFV